MTRFTPQAMIGIIGNNREKRWNIIEEVREDA